MTNYPIPPARPPMFPGPQFPFSRALTSGPLGDLLVGATIGLCVGFNDGLCVAVGFRVVGPAAEGRIVGELVVGPDTGFCVGFELGTDVIGACEE